MQKPAKQKLDKNILGNINRMYRNPEMGLDWELGAGRRQYCWDVVDKGGDESWGPDIGTYRTKQVLEVGQNDTGCIQAENDITTLAESEPGHKRKKTNKEAIEMVQVRD
jgi:hypothetical protein